MMYCNIAILCLYLSNIFFNANVIIHSIIQPNYRCKIKITATQTGPSRSCIDFWVIATNILVYIGSVLPIKGVNLWSKLLPFKFGLNFPFLIKSLKKENIFLVNLNRNEKYSPLGGDICIFAFKLVHLTL